MTPGIDSNGTVKKVSPWGDFFLFLCILNILNPCTVHFCCCIRSPQWPAVWCLHPFGRRPCYRGVRSAQKVACGEVETTTQIMPHLSVRLLRWGSLSLSLSSCTVALVKHTVSSTALYENHIFESVQRVSPVAADGWKSPLPTSNIPTIHSEGSRVRYPCTFFHLWFFILQRLTSLGQL